MAIQMRRGSYTDFDPTKMIPAEIAVITNGDPNTTDGKAVYVCFTAGDVRRFVIGDDVEAAIEEALENIGVDWSIIDNKPSTYPTTWGDVANKPSSFPSAWADVSDHPAIIVGTGTQSIKANDCDNNTASGINSFASGSSTTASGRQSFASGNSTTASGSQSHAEGYNTTAASGQGHAEGSGTTVESTAGAGHAEGKNTVVKGWYGHAEGNNTISKFQAQHVFGKFNLEDDSSSTSASSFGTYVEIVGNGADASARSNARTLDWSGNEVLAGKLTVGAGPTADMDVATKAYVDEVAGDAISFTDPNNDGNVVISLT